MEQWRRAAYNILFGKEHPITYALAVVEDGTVSQASCFRGRCCARGELNVNDIVWMKASIHCQIIGRALLKDLIVVDEWL